MKVDRLIVATALFVLALTVSPMMAQTRPATPAGAQTGAVPESKIALVYTDMFLDPKLGIAKFNNLVTTLNREFQPRQTELVQLQERIKTLTNEVNQAQAASAVVDQKSIQAKIDQVEQLKKDAQRKAEDGQAAFERRRKELFAPMQEEIAKALEAYAKAHSINVLIDGSQVPLVYAADSIDITRPFINDFNSKNPATAAVTPPK
ncbi:MAG TPA: OmpH family outer membrane protein [Pyrinomonadaceae bacterium]|nr:OmpH family outer membrane protein [Pyrinomonadaceae bacterium]